MLYLAYSLIWILRFLLGACLFSFWNVVAWRLPRGESPLRGRSRCSVCGKTLTAGELIPCVSFLLQRGRCRGCGAKLSPRYFWVEVLGGACSVGCALRFGGETPRAALMFTALSLLTVVSLMDWDTMEIWDRFDLALALCGLAAGWLFPEIGWGSRLIGVFAVSVPMLVVALIVPGGFGGGDIKLMAAAGLLLGWQRSLFAVFLALLAGGGYGIWLLGPIRRAGRTTSPSAPSSASASPPPSSGAGTWWGGTRGCYRPLCPPADRGRRGPARGVPFSTFDSSTGVMIWHSRHGPMSGGMDGALRPSHTDMWRRIWRATPSGAWRRPPTRTPCTPT